MKCKSDVLDKVKHYNSKLETSKNVKTKVDEYENDNAVEFMPQGNYRKRKSTEQISSHLNVSLNSK